MLRKCFPVNLCRLCGLEKNQGTDVCSSAAKKSGLLSKINKRLSKEGVHIAIGDKLPKFVCSECEVIINDFTEFCKMVNQVQKRLELEKPDVTEPVLKSPLVSVESTREDVNQQENSTIVCSLADSSATVSVGPDGKVECIMCQNYLEAVEHTTLHMVTHGIGTVICHCRMCGHKAELARFVRNTGREENNSVWCENCKFQPTSQNEKVNKVKNKISKQKSHHCEICTKVFHTKAHLTRHQIVHSGAKPFLCEVCGTGFGQKSSLKLHVLTHTGLNPNKCDQCGQCFRFRSSLQSHVMSMHWPNSGASFGPKRSVYTCDHCGKQFSTAYKLNRHYRCHTGDRPFECEDCGRLFSQSCNLNLHQKRHRQLSLAERKQPTPCFDAVLSKDHLPDALVIKSSDQFNSSITTQQSNAVPPAAVPFGNDADEVLNDASDSEFLETILQHPIIDLRVSDEPLTSINTVFDPHTKSPNPATQFVTLSSEFTSGSSHLTPEYVNITSETEKKSLQEKSDLFPDFTHEGLLYMNQTSNLPTDSPTDNVTLPTFSSLQTGSSVSLPNIPH